MRTTHGLTMTSSCLRSPAALQVCLLNELIYASQGEKNKKLNFSTIHERIDSFTFVSTEGIQMYVCNKERYGYLNVPAKPHQTLEDDRINFVHLHLESMSKNRWHSLCHLLITFLQVHILLIQLNFTTFCFSL